MATPPGGGGDVPRAGYYPDPSIPGYIRYWNGGAWVPGTSRPAPKDGEALPAPPVSVAPQLAPSPAPAPSVEETGPVFLDDDPVTAAAQEPSSAWQASTSSQTGFGGDRDQKVSWGADPRAAGAAWPSAGGAADVAGTDSGRTPAGSASGATDRTDAAGTSGGPGDVRPAVPGQGAGGGDPSRAEGTDAPGAGAPAEGLAATAWPAAGGTDRPGAGAGAGGAVATGGPDAGRQAGAPADTRAAVPGQGPGAGAAEDAAAAVAWPPAGGAAGSDAGARAGADRDRTPGAAPAQPGARLGGMPVNPAATAASWPQQTTAGPQPHAAASAAVAPHAQPHAGPGPLGHAQPQSAPGPQAHAAAPATAVPHAQPQPAPAPQPQPQAAPGLPGQAQPAAGPGLPGPTAQGHVPAPASAGPAASSAPGAQDGQPVVPWKPVAEDPFLSAVRAQAAARPAGLGRRLVARIVDGVVLGALVGAVAYPFLSAAVAHIDDKIEAAKQSGVTVQVWLVDSTTSVQFGIVLAAFLVLGALYEALPTAKWGRTLGKKLCGIEVRDIEAHEPPSFGGALRRWLVYGVLGLLGIGVLGVLWCLFDRPWRQCWHDKAARTFVAGKAA
ncbi:RDD family protein [Streptomyces sp. NPDC053493]|uniref:RDD family protein n=1 Tax=Streptomyces sp. NPDC053493 TaxID=3365705 RepID=UPI0037D42829